MEKIIQITSGKGPEECARTVAKVLELLLDDARKNSVEASVISKVKGDLNGTLLSANILVDGANLNEFIQRWQGTVQWVSKSPYRLYHKRKNWFVGVEFFDLPPQIKWNEKDVIFQTYRSSGPGGQNVNKVETAVRAIHVPSGIQSSCSESRSQLQNKKAALDKLRKKVTEEQLTVFSSQIQSQWMEHQALERGNPVMVVRKPLK